MFGRNCGTVGYTSLVGPSSTIRAWTCAVLAVGSLAGTIACNTTIATAPATGDAGAPSAPPCTTPPTTPFACGESFTLALDRPSCIERSTGYPFTAIWNCETLCGTKVTASDEH